MKIRFVMFVSALMLALPLWSAESSPTAETIVKKIGVEEFEKLRADTNLVVLDVRTIAEFEKGRIPGATNIDINSPAFTEKVSALDKEKAYVVNCAVGVRSARACRTLESLGFRKLYDLQPGFDGWKKAGKPVEK